MAIKKGIIQIKKQSGGIWNEEKTNYLKSIDFKQYKSNKCLFGKYNKDNKLIGLLTLYIDNILINGEGYEINYNK